MEKNILFRTRQSESNNNINNNNNMFVNSGMRLVFPIAMHIIETIKQHNTCSFYIHKSKKRKRSKKQYVTMVTNNWVKRLTMEHIRCKDNVGVYMYMYTTTLIIINCIKYIRAKFICRNKIILMLY